MRTGDGQNTRGARYAFGMIPYGGSSLQVRRLRIAAATLFLIAFAVLVGSTIVARTSSDENGASLTIGPAIVIPVLVAILTSMLAVVAATFAQYRLTADSAHAVADERRSLEEAGQPLPETYPYDTRPDTLKYDLIVAIAELVRNLALPAATITAAFFLPIAPDDKIRQVFLAVAAVGAVVLAVGAIVASAVAQRAKANANARWEIAQREAREAAADPS